MGVYRQFVLAIAQSGLARSLGKRYGMALGARRFVAGVSEDDVLTVVRDFKREGIDATIDYLGEATTSAAAAHASADRYSRLIDRLDRMGLASNLSLKLTQMGLAISTELAWENLTAVLEQARSQQHFVRIDMEDSATTDLTLSLFERASKAYPGQVGTVLQAYLFRSTHDLERLSETPQSFRIVKGAYLEPPSIAFRSKAEVDRNFDRMVRMSLDAGNPTAIATHDPARLRAALSYLRQHPEATDRVEFQMLYGVRTELLRELTGLGFRTRVYVPYGEDWFAYFTRRLAERPANLFFFFRALFPGRPS